MSSAHELLQKAAEDGSLDPEQWPRILDYMLARLDEIINEFPKPPSPTPQAQANAVRDSPDRPQQPSASSQDSQTADKENAPPRTSSPSRPPVPTFSADSAPSTSPESLDFPPELISFYNATKTSLRRTFPENPPHTIQRLAELVLQPKQRYKFLPTYLRALDRVVSVSSPTTIFPLPQAVLPNSGGLLNGTTPSASSQLGSDESLGGALLTPIPWLRHDRGSQSELVSESTEIVEGPHGVGRIETVSVMNGLPSNPAMPQSSTTNSNSNVANGETAALQETGPVTQGELLRHEQEAGVVLTNPHTLVSQRTLRSMDAASNSNEQIRDTVESQDEMPHARGPEEMTMEDMGPQSTRGPGLDIEAAVGRPAIKPMSPEKETSGGSQDEEMKDSAEAEAGEEKTSNEDSTMEDKSKDETAADS